MTALWPEFAMAWGRMGLASLPGTVVTNLGEADDAVDSVGVPLAARPLSPAGEYCAILADHTADVDLAYARAKAQSQDGNAIFQKHMPWPILAVAAERNTAGWDVYDPVMLGLLPKYALTPIEFTCPSGMDPGIATRLQESIADALAHMHQVTHAAVCEFAVTPIGLVAVYARAVRAIEFPIMTVLQLRAKHGAACMRFLTPSTGRVERIEGVETTRATPGIAAVEVKARPGDSLRHVTSIAARDAAGYVIAEGENTYEAQARARDAADTVTLVTTALA